MLACAWSTGFADLAVSAEPALTGYALHAVLVKLAEASVAAMVTGAALLGESPALPAVPATHFEYMPSALPAVHAEHATSAVPAEPVLLAEHADLPRQPESAGSALPAAPAVHAAPDGDAEGALSRTPAVPFSHGQHC